MNMTRSDFKKILRQYDYRQTKNNHLLNARRDEIYAKIPEIKDINQKISDSSLQAIEQTMNDPDNRQTYENNTKQLIRTLSERKKSLLLQFGYPENYLSPIYDCPDCKDTGYINNQKCHCLKQAIIDHAYAQSNLNAIIDRENFDHFQFDFYSDQKSEIYGISPLENIRSVYRMCLDFVDHFEQQFSNLIIYGNSGLGKTFLCNSIAKALLDQGKTVIYLSAFELFKLLENYRFRREDQIVNYYDIESIYVCDLLIIDDLGTEFANSFTHSELFNCLNNRLINQKPTVISTNLSPSQWNNQYSERISSRILGNYTQLKIFGEDIRKRKYFN